MAGRVWILFGALLLAGACGGGSSGGSSGECPPPTYTNLSGAWYVEEVLQGDAGCDSGLNQFQIGMTQTDATLVILGRTTFTASICGTRAVNTLPVTVVTSNGTYTYSSIVLSFTSATGFTGSGRWTRYGPDGSCTGTSSFTGTR